jgi:predicted SprT family Zn-dependent metalloprotease
MEKEIAVIRIKLKDTTLKIRRRVELNPDISLEEFHEIIQKTMGWHNCHLHQFYTKEITYAPQKIEGVDNSDRESFEPTETTKLKDILNSTKKFSYLYDLGDCWDHDIVLNRYVEAKEDVKYPICVSAKGLCPPEDVGGVWGYEGIIKDAKSGHECEEFLKTIKHYNLTLEKLKNIENEPVDIEKINKELERFR